MAGKLSQNDIDLQITSTGVEEQIRLLERMPEEMNKHLVKAIKSGNALMKGDEKPRVRRFSGSTADSIRSSVKMGKAGSVTGITGPSNKRLFFFRMMQTGRAAGAPMPRVERLFEFVETKFGTTGKDTIRTAFALARSIQANGIKGEDIARPVMERNKSRVMMYLKDAVDTIVEAMRVKG